ncbi:MAG: hypothetical protein RR677_01300 [Acinetobacter sp.]
MRKHLSETATIVLKKRQWVKPNPIYFLFFIAGFDNNLVNKAAEHDSKQTLI